ncbi:MAG TPA: glycosyltransferase family A protein [Candidatus Methylacidiphilales bacterium]|nr:glycosyltransferase family A protein [Candidatus Methylacidiphilales bacterium]
MVTVLIPTAKRPDMLVAALRSISEQTAIKEIVEVIVSENAGDSRSKEVCQQFPNLPIKYIFREPQMSAVEHFSSLKKASWSGEFTVMLHDDDWWTPDFLRKGIDALNSHSKASTFCCNSYDVNDGDILSCPQSLIFWFGANYPSFKPIWEMDMREVLVASLLDNPVHFSTMMARAEAFRKSAVIYDTGNKWDVDRMFIFELSRYGTVLFSPVPEAFYRFHAQQDTNAHSWASITAQMSRTTEWMINRSGETWESLGDLFYTRICNSPKHLRVRIYDMVLQPWSLPTLIKHLDKSSDLAKLYKEIRSRANFKRWIKPIIPPIFLEWGKRVSSSLKRK